MKRFLSYSIKVLPFFLTISNFAHAYERLPQFPVDAIYGIDNRFEVDEYHDERFIEKSKSIAMQVHKNELSLDKDNPNKIVFNKRTFQSTAKFCKEERFLDQVVLGVCSGFLVGPKTLVTAGHCMPSIDECENYKWVFGYKKDVMDLNQSQVYTCKKIIRQKNVKTAKEFNDYAVIELDRPVEGIKPLKLRKFGHALIDTPLVVIGHPLGLPMKVIDGAAITRMNKYELAQNNKLDALKLRINYFTADIDASTGISGAPVFNQKNGKVEGIYSNGGSNFRRNRNKDCLESYELPGNDHLNIYEKIMRITKVPGL